MGEAKRKIEQQTLSGNAAPGRTADGVAAAAGVALGVVCVMFPLVGPAGAATPYYGKNFIAFLVAAGVALVLSALALKMKLAMRKTAGGPWPWVSSSLVAACLLILLTLFAGILKA